MFISLFQYPLDIINYCLWIKQRENDMKKKFLHYRQQNKEVFGKG